MSTTKQAKDANGNLFFKIADTEFQFRAVSYSGNLNNLIGYDKMGIYALTGSATNRPSDSGANWGILINAVPTYGSQMIFNSNGIWVRSYTGDPLAWTAWKKATTS